MTDRPVALVTGASRQAGIGAAIVSTLAADGWDVATTYWQPYDAASPYGSVPGEADDILAAAAALGASTTSVEADLSDPDAPTRVFDSVEEGLGPVTALVLSHGMDVPDAGVESFDRHFAVNVRASWLLIRELGRRFAGPPGRGRIIALTSDDIESNSLYGSSKAALDRIVLAAAAELGPGGISANALDPGPVDNGWMTDAIRDDLTRATPLGRLGTPQDCANLVRFLCSPEGGWVSGQVLKSNGGLN